MPSLNKPDAPSAIHFWLILISLTSRNSPVRSGGLTLPQGGLGNSIALPLQKQPRDLGNSVFLDDQMVPHEDQWAFLSSVQRIGRTTIDDLVRDAERRGRPARAGSAPTCCRSAEDCFPRG